VYRVYRRGLKTQPCGEPLLVEVRGCEFEHNVAYLLENPVSNYLEMDYQDGPQSIANLFTRVCGIIVLKLSKNSRTSKNI